MVLKIPPPPPIASKDPTFNRWLLEMTSILNSSGGGIDPNNIAGYAALQTQVATNTSDIAILEGTTGGQGSSITILQSQITTINAQIVTLNSTVTTLAARNQVLNGVAPPGAGLGADGDWFADTNAKHIYVKVTGAWVLIV